MITGNHYIRTPLNGKDSKGSSRRYICGSTSENSPTCWQLRAENSDYQLCYRCHLYENIQEEERIATKNLRASSTIRSLKTDSLASGTRSPVKPYYIHPIRPLTAVTAPSFAVTFNQFSTGPVVSRKGGEATSNRLTQSRNGLKETSFDTGRSIPLRASRTADEKKCRTFGDVRLTNNLQPVKSQIESVPHGDDAHRFDLLRASALSILTTQRICSPPHKFHR